MKAIKVTLSDGRELTVHEPQMAQFSVLLRAMPALTGVQKLFDAMQQQQEGVMVQIPDVPPALMAGLEELIAALSGISPDDYRTLSLGDGMGLFMALGEVIPANFTPATRAS